MAALLKVVSAPSNSLQGYGGSVKTASPQRTSSPQKTVSPQPATYNPQVTVGHSINQTPYANPTVYTPPAPSSPNTGGGGTTWGATQPVYDPYAQWGGKAAYDRIVQGYDTQRNTIHDTAADAAKMTGMELEGSILDLVDGIRVGQSAIDNRSINNELAYSRGIDSVYDMVGEGIRSSGVFLANNNATDSSAAEAFAKAYGVLGQRQASDVGNQYQLEKGDIGIAQKELDMQEASGVRKIDLSKNRAVIKIVSEAKNELAALDTAMANASITDRVALEAEKNKVKNATLASLAKYDKMLSSQLKGINPMGESAIRTEATKRKSLGKAPEAQFRYTTEVPTEFQNTGPQASQLPIFTYGNSRRDDE